MSGLQLELIPLDILTPYLLSRKKLNAHSSLGGYEIFFFHTLFIHQIPSSFTETSDTLFERKVIAEGFNALDKNNTQNLIDLVIKINE